MQIVCVEQLTKKYGDFFALNQCNLNVPEGSVFGLLGPNGAGKTTLIRTLMGFLRPTSGKATVDGFDCEHQSLQVRERVSYLPAETKLFRTMRGKACIEFFSSVHPRGNLERANQIAERLQLDTSRRVSFMSTGMRQKLAISCVLSCSSRLVILDEPTANLDPNIRQVVLQLVSEARQKGSTVIFCSHVLSEIEEICDHAAFLRMGQVVESIELSRIPTIHRVHFHKAADAMIPVESGVSMVSQHGESAVCEIAGDIHPHLKWLGQPGIRQVLIESVGLNSIYDRIHTNQDSTS